MMTNMTKYNPQTLIEYQEKHKERKIKRLEKQLMKLKGAA